MFVKGARFSLEFKVSAGHWVACAHAPPLSGSSVSIFRDCQWKIRNCLVTSSCICPKPDEVLTRISPVFPRAGHAAGQWSVCGGGQAEFHPVPVPFPLHPPRGGVLADENHDCPQAAARVLGLPVPRGHPWWRALWAHEPHDSSVWDRHRDGARGWHPAFAVLPGYVSLALWFSEVSAFLASLPCSPVPGTGSAHSITAHCSAEKVKSSLTCTYWASA